MASKYYTVVTDYGVKKMLKAVQDETKVNITEFAVGDGGGGNYEPAAEMTGLKNEVWRGPVNACYISGDSENLLIVESMIPSNVGGFTIREMGIFDDGGGMVAVCNTPDTQKVKISDGILHELDLSMELALTNTDSVELIVDPNVVTATKKDVKGLQDQINQLSGSVGSADKYNANIQYQTGDYCIYGDVLYKCTKPTTGEWDAGCWQRTDALTEIGELQNQIDRLDGNRMDIAYEPDDKTLAFFYGASGGGGSGGYMLPAASKEQLGGVKIGEGIAVDGDGTISVDVLGAVSGAAASDAEVSEMLAEVFDS